MGLSSWCRSFFAAAWHGKDAAAKLLLSQELLLAVGHNEFEASAN